MHKIIDNQKVYNSKWFQERFIDKYQGDPGLYLTRLLNFNYNALAKDFDGVHYDSILKCPNINYEVIGDNLYVTIDEMKFIMDSTYFEFINENELSINIKSLTTKSYPLSTLLVIKYKYIHENIDQKAELKLYLYDSLKGIIYPDEWDHESHYIFLSLKHIFYNSNTDEYSFIDFYPLPLPKCVNEGIASGLCSDIIPEKNYEHSHTFTHTHEHIEPHTHTNILIDFTDIGGMYTQDSCKYYITTEFNEFILNNEGFKLLMNECERECIFSLYNDNNQPILDEFGNIVSFKLEYNEFIIKLRHDIDGYYIEDESDNRYYLTNDIPQYILDQLSIPFISEENQLPNCKDFIDYRMIDSGKIVIQNIQYVYNYDYCYYLKYVRYFLWMLNENILKYYVRNIKLPKYLDLLYSNLHTFFGNNYE